jgi:hypothetical protein
MGMRKVFANFTSVVNRRSFSPRSMAPVKDRARLPRCASSSCDHFLFFRSARTRLPRRFVTAVAFSIAPTITLPLYYGQRSVVGRAYVGISVIAFVIRKLTALATVFLQTLQDVISIRMSAVKTVVRIS